MASGNMKFQVKSSTQYLNILDGSNANGSLAGQSPNPNSNQFLWQVSPDPDAPGYFKIQVQTPGKQWLNILNLGMNNGDLACQGNNPTTDNFRWQFEESAANPGYYLIKVKHSQQYLNILGGGGQPGTHACQGNNPTTNNFLWTVPAKAVKISMQLDCANILQQPEGPLSEQAADAWVSFSDDNGGGKEGPHQTSFKTDVYNGSQVTWDASPLPGTQGNYGVSVDDIDYESNSDDNIFSSTDVKGSSGKVTAYVLPTAPVLPGNADNESYTIVFTITPNGGTAKRYSVDPKLRVNPSN
ncbi:RICIN domain-containing protein [Robiginitalea sp. SC105]|uniref:RICIN domain-containing protein n=1 Tax=Robiginitalea sp. SC105 TaxID=2762332 RepID=UPI001639C815|nr:RICIN domain-containing protein [Robiginitalea sp. SC105]MBC2838140.1 RICIN domain-containing protein [Robiginitalea sp. SC105]